MGKDIFSIFVVEMRNTEKKVCRMLAQLLAEYGVEDVVLCPGNRNAPIIMAVERQVEAKALAKSGAKADADAEAEAGGRLRAVTVVDERVAAFVALGMAAQSGKATAVVCTSGSALLNCAPAVAEAYYRHIPLVVVSADRPADFIDNGQPQTVRQRGALDNIVRCSVDIEPEDGSERQLAYATRRLNRALTAAVGHPRGPVHINIQIDTPLANEADAFIGEHFRKISITGPTMELSTPQARALGRELAPPRKVLIVCGAMAPDARVRRAVSRLAAIPNIAVVAETVANVGCGVATTACNIDAVIAAAADESRQRQMQPDVLITLGAPLVAGRLGAFLSDGACEEHWCISEEAAPADTYGILTRHIQLPPASFLPQLASAVQPFRHSNAAEFSAMWCRAAQMARYAVATFRPSTRWNDFTAMREIANINGTKFNVHISNGMNIRLFQTLNHRPFHRVDCNRGVSGIDGSTSTAIGAAMVTETPVLLLSGDMSAQYDIGALALNGIPPTFRMVVFSNGGGNIFRVVEPTRNLEERERRFCNIVNLPLEQLANSYGFNYYRARAMDELRCLLPDFLDVQGSSAPAIFNIVTDGEESAGAWHEFMRHLLKPCVNPST